MSWLISAPSGPPRFEGGQLLAAARAIGLEAELFDHPTSRDPTLELPELVRRLRPEVLLLAEPAREEVETIRLAQEMGSRVVLWMAPLPPRAPGRLLARRRWLARQADLVAVADAGQLGLLLDRRQRSAVVVPAGYQLSELGGAGPGGQGRTGGVEGRSSDDGLVLVRAADDPLHIDRSDRCPPILGYGPVVAFPPGCHAGELQRGADFAELVRGRRYLAGGRPAVQAPGLFDAEAAAAALGATLVRVGFMGRVENGAPVIQDPSGGSFEMRFKSLIDRLGE